MRNLIPLLVALAVVGWFTRCPSEQFALTYLRADDACVLVSQLVPGCQAREVAPKTIAVSGSAALLVEVEQLLTELDQDTPEIRGVMVRLTPNGSKQLGVPLSNTKPGRIKQLEISCSWGRVDFVGAATQFLVTQGEATILKDEQGRQVRFACQGATLTIGYGWAIWAQPELVQVSRWEPQEGSGFYSLAASPGTCCVFQLSTPRLPRGRGATL